MLATPGLSTDAVERHAWEEGVDALTAADREAELSPDDLGSGAGRSR